MNEGMSIKEPPLGKDTIAQKAASTLLDVGAVSIRPDNPFTYSSGIQSPVYTDCRLLMAHVPERRLIRDLYIELLGISGKEYDAIAGTSTAGIPHAAWIAEKMDLPMVYVRGKAKDHGKGNRVEGKVEKGNLIAVVEDLISTGGSSAESAIALRDNGAIADDVFAIITYGMEKAAETYAANGLKLHVMTDFRTLLNVARDKGAITEEQIPLVLDWAQDPQTWGERHGFK